MLLLTLIIFLSNRSNSRGTYCRLSCWVCIWETFVIQLNLICLHRVEQSIKSLLWYQKYQKNKKVYCFLEKFFPLMSFYSSSFVFFSEVIFCFSSWTFWAAIHRRRHPSGKMPKFTLTPVYTTHSTLQNNTYCIFNNSCATCWIHLYLLGKCHILNLSFWYMYFHPKISPTSQLMWWTFRNEPKMFSIHGNCGCDSLVYSFQRRCHNSYYACSINHFEDRATVIWCQQYYLE